MCAQVRRPSPRFFVVGEPMWVRRGRDDMDRARQRVRGPAVTLALAGFLIAGVGAGVVVVARDDPSEPVRSVRLTASGVTKTVAFDANGDLVDLPTNWFRAVDPLAPQLLDPHEVIAVSTFPLPGEGHAAVCVGDAPPAKALGEMAAEDALIWIIEWTPMPAPNEELVPNVGNTDDRPTRFEPGHFKARDCVTRAFSASSRTNLLFKDQGRVFEISVVYGENISPSRLRLIYDTLDTLRFRNG